MGQFVVAMKLKRHSDDLEWVVVFIYSFVNVSTRDTLWEELAEVASAFQGPPSLLEGDFNVTLKMEVVLEEDRKLEADWRQQSR